VFVLRLSSATLTAYVANSETGAYSAVPRRQLPWYFHSPAIREETMQEPWITVGGDHPLLDEVPQVETAAFGGNRLYAIRNYSGTREKVDFPRHEMDSRWIVDARGLEIYSLEGELLGSYEFPTATPFWLRADSRGRIFLGVGQDLVISLDPTFDGIQCPKLPELITLTVEDRPFNPADPG
jgi:hypothetical protein